MDWWQQLQQADVLRTIFLAVLGAVVGSFASAAIYRIPREGTSLLNPVRSHCPICRATIAWYDNLPILSYLLLRGRCRSCKIAYGPGYMIHEVVMSALFVAAGSSWALQAGPWAMLVVLVVLAALWIAAAVDWNWLILPDGITLGGIPFAMAASLLVPELHLGGDLTHLPWGVDWVGLSLEDAPAKVAFASAALGSSISFLALIGIRALFSYLLRQEALGLGDVKLLAAVGALLGLEGAVWTLLIGVASGAVLGLLNIVRMTLVVRQRRRRRGRTRVLKSSVYMGWWLGRLFPFGPPLVLGTALVLLLPDQVREFFLVTWPNSLRGPLP